MRFYLPANAGLRATVAPLINSSAAVIPEPHRRAALPASQRRCARDRCAADQFLGGGDLLALAD